MPPAHLQTLLVLAMWLHFPEAHIILRHQTEAHIEFKPSQVGYSRQVRPGTPVGYSRQVRPGTPSTQLSHSSKSRGL